LPNVENCQNQHPRDAGCLRDARRLAVESVRRGRATIGRIELWGSASCKTKWARTLVYREAGRNLEVSATILIGRDASAGVDRSGPGSIWSNMVFQGDEDGVVAASGLIGRRGGTPYGATTEDR
jgi:hypothetical protein